MPSHPARNSDHGRPGASAYAARATAEPTSPTASALTGSAVTPPSPSDNAWMRNTSDNARNACRLPSSTAIIPTPVMCAVVPPGSGMVTSISAYADAVATARRGTAAGSRVRRSRRSPAAHSTPATP